MEQILPANGLPKETVTAKMMLYKNTKVKLHSLDGDTYFFNIIACVLLRDILIAYMFRICRDYVLRTSINLMKENGFTLKKGKKQMIPRTNHYRHSLYRRHTAMANPCAARIQLGSMPSTQAESSLHSLAQGAGCICFYVNVDKTEYMCFNQL